MRYTLFSALALSVILTVSQVANARNYGYFGFRGGVSEVGETEVADERLGEGFGSAYLGTGSGPFRAELEYTYVSNADFELQEMEARFQRAMGQLYIDLPVTRYVIPYLNVGAGAAFHSVEDKNEKVSGSEFAWNAGAGLGIRLTRNLTFDSGFRYVDMGEVEMADKQLNFESYEGYIGLRFLF